MLIGIHESDKIGIELIIGGSCINERLDEVMTLADVRLLRDKLQRVLLVGGGCNRMRFSVRKPHSAAPRSMVY